MDDLPLTKQELEALKDRPAVRWQSDKRRREEERRLRQEIEDFWNDWEEDDVRVDP